MTAIRTPAQDLTETAATLDDLTSHLDRYDACTTLAPHLRASHGQDITCHQETDLIFLSARHELLHHPAVAAARAALAAAPVTAGDAVEFRAREFGPSDPPEGRPVTLTGTVFRSAWGRGRNVSIRDQAGRTFVRLEAEVRRAGDTA